MTSAFTVVFEENLSKEQTKMIKDLFYQIRNVAHVTEHHVDMMAEHVAMQRAKLELTKKLWETLK
jgi:pyrroline-5-carboxylate reductase